jgi:hypothetical protein
VRLALVAAAAAALTARAEARPHPGKVVRVARGLRAFGTPRLCNLQADAVNQISGQCVGVAPAPGEIITVLDAQHVIARVRVSGVTAVGDGSCPDAGLWVITATALTGQLHFAEAVGVIDVPVDPRAGRLAKQLQTDTPVREILIDGNGDGEPDFRFVLYSCDDAGNATTRDALTCVDAAVANGRGYTPVRQDKIRQCL